ncbi:MULTISPECIES: hypothetical protein [unclassified Bradyrhizobium]|uniref:hypothetical protein n=1 Tax=unclassified Bradyrhizobium TaxID=2631580 RepID=UPI0028E65D33|nr:MULTISPECIES: hypothetical protein [unclassified Bradyrhizobium]
MTNRRTVPTTSADTDQSNTLPFRYSATQWSEIVAQIPAVASNDAVLMFEVRAQLEAAAAGYLTMTAAHKARFANGSRAQETLEARDHISAARQYASKTGNAALAGHLDAALSCLLASEPVDGLDMLKKAHRGNTDPARDLLYDLALRTWTGLLKLPLTTGRPSNATGAGTRKPNSPAVRFLVAAVSGVTDIRAEAAERIIEVEKRRVRDFEKGRAGRQSTR